MNDVVPPYDLLVRFHWTLLTGQQTTDGLARLEDKTGSRLNGEKHSASSSSGCITDGAEALHCLLDIIISKYNLEVGSIVGFHPDEVYSIRLYH